MAIRLTFYGGVGEIGGNLISFRLEKERIHVLFDVGLSFSAYRRFFDFPFRIPQESVKLELIETEILPKIDSLDGKPMRYYADLAKGGRDYRIVEPPATEMDIEDVFISHLHSDHSKLCTLLASSCKIHMGELACCLFLKNALLSSRSDLFSKLFFSDAKSTKARHSYSSFESKKAIRIGSVEILPIAVDHSTPSSFGFIATCPNGTIAYTGDIRFHGIAANLSREFIQEVRRRNVDLLITEGTNIGEARPQGEEDVSKFTSKLIERSNRTGNNLTLVKVSPSDIDRISSIVSIARELDNKIVLTKGVASTIHVASNFKDRLKFVKVPDLQDCRILIMRDSSDSISPTDRYVRFLEQEGLSGLFLNLSEYRSNYSQVPHVIISRGDINLFKLKPPPRSLYIFSTSEPATEEEEFNLERELNTAQLLGLLFYHVHASGHASPLDLVEMVRQILPKKLIPIHTEHPNIFSKIFSNYVDVILPQKGKPILI